MRPAYAHAWIALLALALYAPHIAAQSGKIAPPRTIHDITQLLDQYKPDPAKVEELKAKVNREPPAAANRDVLLRFYVERAQAAQGLGMVTRQIADLSRAVELVKGTEDEWTIVQDLFGAELQSGNFATAINLKERMPQLVGSRRGRLFADYATLANLYANIGDRENARTSLRRLQAENLNQAQSASWARFGDNWTAHIERAHAVALEAEGKPADAEPRRRNAVAAAERWLAVAAQVVDQLEAPERHHSFLDDHELGLAGNLTRQGRLLEAELAVRNVLRRVLNRLGRYAPTTAITVGQFAGLLNAQGRSRDAEAMARAAVDIHMTIGSAPGARPYVNARRALGTALVLQARWQDGLAVFEEMRADLAKDPASLERIGRHGPMWALALIKSGRAAEAVPIIEDRVGRAREQLGPSHYNVAQWRGFLAMALAETGQQGRALAEFQEAIKVLLVRGRADSDEESGISARMWRLAIILEGYIKLLHEIRSEARAGFDPAAEAFRMADALRGQGAQRALAASAARAAANDPALAELVRREQDTKQHISVLYSTLLRLLNAPADQQLPRVVAQMRTRIPELEKERRALFADLEKRFPAYVNLINPKPATVEEARTALREGEALVSVFATEERTYVWVVPRQGAVGFHASKMGEQAASRIVGQLRRALDPGQVALERFPDFDITGAHRLYVELLKPVEGAWKGAHTLMVVANGALGQLPFTVLPTEPVSVAADSGLKFERYRAVPWLVKQVAVTQLPAVSTLVTLRALPQGSAARSPFIGFGDPQFGAVTPAASTQPVALRMRNAALPRPEEGGKPADWTPYSQLAPLPDTREEILSIAQTLKADPQKDVFLGLQASKDNVKKSDLRNRRIVAFATHGLIPGDFPNLEEPALALSAPDGNAETGLLTLGDILGLKMDADLVVLSACNTAAGDGAGADAISGLGRGFFYAGSRALLVTHWPVETRSARLLVTNIFERYANTASVSRAEALRQASIEVMQDSAKDAGGKPLFSYAHPVFWAPYALVGDGGR